MWLLRDSLLRGEESFLAPAANRVLPMVVLLYLAACSSCCLDGSLPFLVCVLLQELASSCSINFVACYSLTS